MRIALIHKVHTTAIVIWDIGTVQFHSVLCHWEHTLKELTKRPENGGCVDVNECMDNPCMKNALCLNTLGSFQCQCKGKWSASRIPDYT